MLAQYTLLTCPSFWQSPEHPLLSVAEPDTVGGAYVVISAWVPSDFCVAAYSVCPLLPGEPHIHIFFDFLLCISGPFSSVAMVCWLGRCPLEWCVRCFSRAQVHGDSIWLELVAGCWVHDVFSRAPRVGGHVTWGSEAIILYSQPTLILVCVSSWSFVWQLTPSVLPQPVELGMVQHHAADSSFLSPSLFFTFLHFLLQHSFSDFLRWCFSSLFYWFLFAVDFYFILSLSVLHWSSLLLIFSSDLSTWSLLLSSTDIFLIFLHRFFTSSSSSHFLSLWHFLDLGPCDHYLNFLHDFGLSDHLPWLLPSLLY